MPSNGGLVILDIDGVVLRGSLIMALSRAAGPLRACACLWNCLRFDKGIITLRALLGSVYRRLAGKPMDAVWEAYRAMALTPGARDTVQALKERGRTVLLLSSGVPGFIVDDLVERLDADGGAGIDLVEEGGLLTGEFGGELVGQDGKRACIDRLLTEKGLRWDDVVVVGDDHNNLSAMLSAGVSIGFGAMREVRRHAKHLVDEPDLTAILPVIDRAGGAPEVESVRRERSWRGEVIRKVFHAAAVSMALLLSVHPESVLPLLILAAVLYVIIEDLRLNGFRLPLLWRIQKMAMRGYEARGLAVAPLTLALGVGVCMGVYERPVAITCILVVALADSTAAVIGQRWGRIQLPYSRRKTLEGSLAGTVVAVACGAPFLPLWPAVIGGVAAGLVESLNLRDWDNLLVPVAAGAAMQGTMLLTR